MSPNGLRRWRRYAKKCRYRSRKEGKRATGATAQGATVRALFWMAKNHPNFALPPKPFTPRSLVGMSQGARKRAHHKAVLALEHAEVWRGDVVDRSRFRIGQKLRPCVGCLRCQCRSAFDAWPELGEELANDHPTCDGSGVLPARKAALDALLDWRHR